MNRPVRAPRALLVLVLLVAPMGASLLAAPARAAYEDQLVWPVSGRVTSIYWECRSDCARYHRGVDLASARNDPVYAARSGVVSFVGWDENGYGNYVMLDHEEGYTTLYAHLARVDVSQGQSVTTATRIGLEGTTGASTGCHVHFEVRQDDEGPSVEVKQFVPGRSGDTYTRGAPIPYADTLVEMDAATSVRDGPGVTLVAGQGNAVVGTAGAGERYVGYSSWTNSGGATWLAISFNGRVGWIPATSAHAIGGTALRVSADGALNVRSGAGSSNGIVGRVHGGQAYAPLASATDAGGATWHKIPYDGSDGAGVGWIHGGYTRSQTFAGPTPPPSGSLVGKKIAVDAGHGGSDPGSQGFGTNEKAVTLAIATRLAALLEADGASVLMTREGDSTVSLSARTDAANAWGAHRFISVHANACGSCGARGTETYYHDSLAPTSTSGRWASETQPRVVAEAGTQDRGVKQADFHVLRETAMPAILVETAFIDTASDHAILVDPASQQRIALGMLYGIQVHFGLPPHDPTGGGDPPATGLAEDFEGGSAVEWALANASGSATWHVHAGEAATGTRSLAIHDYGPDEQDDAITPAVDLAGIAAPVLRFSSWMEGERGCVILDLACTVYDGGSVALTTDGGATWTTVLADHYATAGWQTIAIDLAGFADETIAVRYRFESDGSTQGRGWFVDDVRIGEASGVDPDPDPSAFQAIFETGNDGMVALDASGPAAWSRTTARAAQGATSIAIRNYGANEDDALLTPTISLGAGASLRFASWLEGEESCTIVLGCTRYDTGRVDVSADEGATWTALYESAGIAAWETVAIPLDAYAGRDVRLRFAFTSDGSVQNEGWYVDDVRVG